MRLWQKLFIIGGYAYGIATVQLPIAIGDSSFFYGKQVLSPFGWAAGPGTSDPYLRPSGIDVLTAVTGVLVFALLFRYYRSEKSPLVRGQTKYLILGLLFFFASAFAIGISRDLGAATIPNPQAFLASIGDFVLLLGLRRKGFYSVTPVAETATAAKRAARPDAASFSRCRHEAPLVSRPSTYSPRSSSRAAGTSANTWWRARRSAAKR